MQKIPFKIRGLIIFVFLIIFPATCRAVNFYDGARTKGLYLLTYTSLYYADKTTDYKGDPAREDYGYKKLEELLRLCYYKDDLVLTVFVPAGLVKSGFYRDSSEGLCDINLGAGYFLPVKSVDLLPMLFVKLPTGEYDSRKNVNYGSNQYDIKPTVFIYKSVGRFSLDAAAKYFFREQNHSTKVSPGDEFYLQGLLGWQFTKAFKAGPSLNWMRSASSRNNGDKASGSRRESFSAGTDLYLRLPKLSLTFTYLRDISAKNTTKGDFFQLKTCYKF
jgi:hypothetical protein